MNIDPRTIEIQKFAKRRLSADVIKSNIKKIMERAMGSSRGAKGWSVKIMNDDYQVALDMGDDYRYNVKLQLVHKSKKERTMMAIENEWEAIIKVVMEAGNPNKWEIFKINDKDMDQQTQATYSQKVTYAPVEFTKDWDRNLAHIYERDAQRDIIKSSIDAGVVSDFHNRFHCALIGDPACGKSDTLKGFKDAIGDEAVLEFDATSTTQAGAIKELNEREIMPRVLIVEEIEKASEESLRWLLAVMDVRAEIRKVNFRQNIQKETKLLTLATVNNYKLFTSIMSGALASRFSHHIFFPRPSRELLERILQREVARIKGNKKWIRPALDYAMEMQTYDPRRIIAICLCGGDDLLSGKYQDKLRLCYRDVNSLVND